MGRRVMLVVLAILVAGAGTGLVFVYARASNQRMLARQNPVQVLFATKLIPQGTTGAEAERNGSFGPRTIAGSAAFGDALRPSAQATIHNRVALVPIYPGEQIVKSKFGSQGDSTVLPIKPGMVATSINTSDPATRVAGNIRPGNHVDIFATAGTAARLLLPNVLVLAVGANSLSSTGTSQTSSSGDKSRQQDIAPPSVLTLALDVRQTMQLLAAKQNGQIQFALLPPGATPAADAGQLTPGNLFSSKGPS